MDRKKLRVRNKIRDENNKKRDIERAVIEIPFDQQGLFQSQKEDKCFYISPWWYIVVLLVIVVVVVLPLLFISFFLFCDDWLIDCCRFVLTCSDIAAGIPLDKDHVIHFFCSCQLLVRELHKSYRLIQRKPLDMTSFYGEMFLSLEPNLKAKYTGTLATGRKLYKHEILIQFMSSRRQ